MKPHVVRARSHHGSSSLDVTVPADLRKKFKLEPGDIFRVDGQKGDDGTVTLTYTKLRL